MPTCRQWAAGWRAPPDRYPPDQMAVVALLPRRLCRLSLITNMSTGSWDRAAISKTRPSAKIHSICVSLFLSFFPPSLPVVSAAMTNCYDMFGISRNRSVLGRPAIAAAVGSAGAQFGGWARPRCHPPARRDQSRESPRKPTRGSIAPGDLVPRAHQSQRSRGSFETSTTTAAAGHISLSSEDLFGIFSCLFDILGRRFLGS